MHVNDTLSLPDLQSIVASFEREFTRGQPDECWLWTGLIWGEGYGRFDIGKGRGAQYAHRMAYVLHYGPFPGERGRGKNATICRHKCDNRLCVNPAHLTHGRQYDNIHDALDRGRVRIGAVRWGAKLTEKEALAILHHPSQNNEEIAQEFGVSRANVWRIKHRKRWKHLA